MISHCAHAVRVLRERWMSAFRRSAQHASTHGGVVAMLAVGALLAGGCASNAATGRYQFNTLDRESEIETGEAAMPELVQEYGGHYQSPALDAYVSEVGMRLVEQVEDPEKRSLPWEFTVLDSDVINAFALPGGKVFISRALLQNFESEAQLAGVLGHEVGHVTAEHAEERMGQATTVNVLGGIAGAAASVFGGGAGASIAQATSVLVGTGGQGFLLKFSRDQESEADTLGVRYMIKSGYDPEGMIQVLKVLKAASDSGGTPEILATHPYPDTRLQRTEELLAEQYPGQRGNSSLKMGVDTWKSRAAPNLPPLTPAETLAGGAGPRDGSRDWPQDWSRAWGSDPSSETLVALFQAFRAGSGRTWAPPRCACGGSHG